MKTFCQQYPPMPNLLPFHYELFCRQKLENSLCQLGYSKEAAEIITARIPFEDLPKMTPEEIGAIWKAEVDARLRQVGRLNFWRKIPKRYTKRSIPKENDNKHDIETTTDSTVFWRGNTRSDTENNI